MRGFADPTLLVDDVVICVIPVWRMLVTVIFETSEICCKTPHLPRNEFMEKGSLVYNFLLHVFQQARVMVPVIILELVIPLMKSPVW